MPATPTERIFPCNDAPLRGDRRYVLYWMIANRRPRANFALQRAVELANELGRPLLVFEPLRVGYRWASDRHHAFVVAGMRDHAIDFDVAGCRYAPYVEPKPGAGSGLLEALADDACAVVTDHFPAFFLPRMVEAAAQRLDVRMESVDANGLMPLREHGRAFARAYDFRRHLHKALAPHLDAFPDRAPLERLEAPRAPTLRDAITERWGPLRGHTLDDLDVSALPIDHDVPPVDLPGGSRAGRERAERFVSERLDRYPDDRNHPDAGGGSGLSPYLHFGHVGAHEVASLAFHREGWTTDALADKGRGQREGWWGASDALEAFLDELITWRELGYGYCHYHPDDYDRFETLPDWALRTLDDHRDDERTWTYDLDTFDRAQTHDEIWNAAQRELRATGRMHNYLRMLWGKKVLHWTKTPEEALEILIELNNRYALDGRDPNSYSGIFWTFGRFDRAWGPERPIFGKVRYMTSDSTRKKLRLNDYLDRWGERRQGALF